MIVREGALDPQPPSSGARVQLPSMRAGESIDYYFEILDQARNVLLEVGSTSAPFHLTAVAADLMTAPSGVRRYRASSARRAALVVGGVSLVLAGLGIGLDAAAASEYGRLEESVRPRVCRAIS